EGGAHSLHNCVSGKQIFVGERSWPGSNHGVSLRPQDRETYAERSAVLQRDAWVWPAQPYLSSQQKMGILHCRDGQHHRMHGLERRKGYAYSLPSDLIVTEGAQVSHRWGDGAVSS